MRRSMRFGILLAASAAVCLVMAWCNSLPAQDESSVVVPQSPVEQPAVAQPLAEPTTVQPEMIPAVPTTPTPVEKPFLMPDEELAAPAGAIVVYPVARIDYDVTHRARRLFGGSPFVELSMVTQNPADGCFYEIPMCLPACCTGEPKVTSYCGLFGRGVVVYCYECGLEIEVKFRLRGDVEVEYGT